MTSPDDTTPVSVSSPVDLTAVRPPGLLPSEPQRPLSTVSTYPLSFTGSAAEYFRLWIVNVALSIVTLGFYSPWARVRTRQYFYGHTWLDGHNFEYTANPWALLRGYLIVLAFALTYTLSVRVQYSGFEYVVGIILALFVLTYPWLVRQSMRFLAQSTVHRGIRFRFTGTLGGSYFAYGVANILGVLSLGLALPWAWSAQRNYQVRGVAYGTAQGHFRGSTGGFYLIALAGMGLSVGLFVLAFLIILGSVALAPKDFSGLAGAGSLIGVAVGYAFLLLLYVLPGEYVRGSLLRDVLGHVELGGVVRLAATFSPWRLIWITVSNTLAQLLTLGLLTPWATIRRTRYLLEHLQIRAITSLDDFTAVNTSQETALGEAATELLDINIGF